ncbi:MAG: zinc ABC transporter substrate-binding protein ZnuA [Candidatus Endonucleobacter bathymodioli]|uniref:High-affinity zinc uptake system protein ZnuA n=1 Tax=Candidatus Endonucleibacter bathymodioli TaxID=539814 RepID=A0AA90NN24_9GAMM|nr:zinc ABC transporter substrate-binding protein ZnuA [Candidatus Endonucleobacter bathymodioli]
MLKKISILTSNDSVLLLPTPTHLLLVGSLDFARLSLTRIFNKNWCEICFITFVLALSITISANEPASHTLNEKITPLSILASIKPLQLISQAITNGVLHTDILLPPGASPHDYCLKFSDRKKLDSADLVLWIGPTMETFLTSPLKSSNNQRNIAMMDIADISHRKEQKNNDSKHSKYKYQNSCHHNSHQHRGEHDPHIWLSPKNALVIAKAIKKELLLIDKNEENQKKYNANLLSFQKMIREADQQNIQLLQDVKHKPFFVFHDAYGHLQDHYNLTIAGYFAINPQQQPGARHLDTLRRQLKAAGPTSVFREPQFQPSYINRLTEGLPVNITVLDPLATGIPITPDGYIIFIQNIVLTIRDTLNNQPEK